MSSVDSMFDYSGLIPRYFDIVIQGGGPTAIYLLGLYDTLKKLEKTGDIRIFQYAGSDVAAMLCVFLCVNVDKKTMMDFCHMMFEDITNDRWKREFLRILPSNAYIICSHRVHIYTSVSTCSLLSFYRPAMVFSVYRSNRDLVEACCISFRKPYRVDHVSHHKQLRIRLSHLNERFDRLVFSQKGLFQFYKMTRMKELVMKAEQDAGHFFLHPSSALSHPLLKWHESSSPKKYKILFFFVPTVAVLFFLFRKK